MAIENSHLLVNRNASMRPQSAICARTHKHAVTLLFLGTTMLGAGAARAQQSDAALQPVVMLTTPHAAPEARSKLPSHMASVILEGVRRRVAHIPSTVVRSTPAAETSCTVTDYECKVKTSQRAARDAKSVCAAKDDDCKILRHRSVDWIVDVQVQDNGNGTFYIVNYLYDVQRPDNTIGDKSSQGTIGSGPQLSAASEEALVTHIAERVAALFQSAPKGSQPASTSKEALQDQKMKVQTLALDVTVVGPGRVVSQPKGLDCIQGNGCSAKFQAVAEQKLVTLRAEPTGAAASVIWSGSPCQNSILTDPRRCDLPISGSQKVTVGFERSSQRKIATGVFGGLAGAGLVISAVLLGLNGQDAGRCGDGGITHSSGCVYNLITPGLVTTGLTVGLGVGTALIWWLPTARESK